MRMRLHRFSARTDAVLLRLSSVPDLPSLWVRLDAMAEREATYTLVSQNRTRTLSVGDSWDVELSGREDGITVRLFDIDPSRGALTGVDWLVADEPNYVVYIVSATLLLGLLLIWRLRR